MNEHSLLDSFTPREQELFLISTMREGGEKLDAAYRAWESGDAAALEEATLGELKRDPSLEPVFEKLIFARNRAMAAAIERRMQGKGPVFVVVGAAHLVGPRGIVELLRRKGYRVEQQ
ncbi:TraB/GumN family protein [Geobacter sp.]|uniref:TraB/GumN family protein n=1 Tax=Geobacter sp. TaxID=46610 RepID=UPI00261A1E92|nr:TraB/GumN family protein [Geobacter sp.]